MGIRLLYTYMLACGKRRRSKEEEEVASYCYVNAAPVIERLGEERNNINGFLHDKSQTASIARYSQELAREIAAAAAATLGHGSVGRTKCLNERTKKVHFPKV